jgi:hypothetical protein
MSDTQIFIESHGILLIFVAYQEFYDAEKNLWITAYVTGDTGSGNTDDEYICIKWNSDNGVPVFGITAEYFDPELGVIAGGTRVRDFDDEDWCFFEDEGRYDEAFKLDKSVLEAFRKIDEDRSEWLEFSESADRMMLKKDKVKLLTDDQYFSEEADSDQLAWLSKIWILSARFSD